MCKVFLQHLSALSSRATFPALWARVVDVQRALIAPPADDALTEAALESLKNMILVMDSVRIFSNGDSYNDLWYITWEKIGEFLPNLKEELFPQVVDNTKPASNLPSHMQPTLSPSLPTLIPVGTASTPTILPVPSPPSNIPSYQRPIQIQTSIPSPILVASMASPVNLGQTPPLVSSTPTLVAPTPISGMVPIRNPLYDQAGLTSSVLLQPLNEMISTPIGISIQSQMPILYPQTTTELQQSPKINTNKTESYINPTEPIIQKQDEQSDLYMEYISNPYNDAKISPKEATLYDPESQELPTEQTVPDPESQLRNPLLAFDKQKSLSENATPMHNNKAQFGSSDNVRQDAGIFNFSSYFVSGNEMISPGSEVFDTLMSAQEG